MIKTFLLLVGLLAPQENPQPEPMVACGVVTPCPDGSQTDCDAGGCRCYGGDLSTESPSGLDSCQDLRRHCRGKGSWSCGDVSCECQYDPYF